MPNSRTGANPHQHMRALGDDCVYWVASAQSKLLPRGWHGRTIGYSQGTTLYTILDTKNGKVLVSRDVTCLQGEAKPKQHDITPSQIERIDHSSKTQNTIEEPRPAKKGREVQFLDTNEPNHTDVKEEEQPPQQDNNQLGEEEEKVEEEQLPVLQGRGNQYWHIHLNQESAPSPESNQEDKEEDEICPIEPAFAKNQPCRLTHLQGGAPAHCPLHNIVTVTGYIAKHALSAQEVNNPQSYCNARNSPDWPSWKEAMDEEMGKMDKYLCHKGS